MSETKTLRLSKVAKELNVGLHNIVEFLETHGHTIESNPNAKIDEIQYGLLLKEFQSEKLEKEKIKVVNTGITGKVSVNLDEKLKSDKYINPEDSNEEVLVKDTSLKPKEEVEVVVEPKKEETIKSKVDGPELTVVGKIDLTEKKKTKKVTAEEEPKKKEVVEEPTEEIEKKTQSTEKVEEEKIVEEIVVAPPVVEEKEIETFKAHVKKLEGPTILGKIELPKDPAKSQADLYKDDIKKEGEKKKRQRIKKDPVKKVDPQNFNYNKGTGTGNTSAGSNFKKGGSGPNRGPANKTVKPEVTDEDIQKQIKETLARLSERGKSKSVKLRKEKRGQIREKIEEEALRAEEDKMVIKVTEFVSANELASMMDVKVTEVISACMSLGLFVSINQRLDAETISIIAEEFGFTVNFVSAEIQESIDEEVDEDEDLSPRSPVITVMGHVDHGKTSLLDYIRKANVIAGEAGGITQHIGAYNVTLEDGRHLCFIDTPGHEAFTAMRARGAQITDVAIIVIAADDSVMPQTIEAINHAKAAGVPIVFAINKIDKPGANPDKIREALAGMNFLVEEWGGTYQCQEISAKQGLNIDKLLDKVLLQAEFLDLKANPDRRATGSVIEAQLDKGKGYICTVLIQNGTLRKGDVILAGPYSGRVKAMYNERDMHIDIVGPSSPVRILGLTGAPQAGDKFNVMEDEREAREIAAKRLQLQREQGMRAKKHITLDEIGRRIAIGDFQQLNIIIKGDTDGSVEALSDSLLKLSTQKIQVNVIHKSVGAISESDVLLASASDAIIIGFQVRPSGNAKKVAEKEEIDIRTYSIIYQAIDEVKAAMLGMLAPEYEEKVMGNIEVREVFNITKVGQVAGCYVLDGRVSRAMKIRIIRDGIVVHTGKISALKRFKDDVKEVTHGYECGLSIERFEKIEVGDIIEAFEEVEIKAKL
jgi:translation initiation factor IF-2